jgi:hypothetical protein
MSVEFRAITDFPSYCVDSLGNVWSIHSGKWKKLKPSVGGSGYLQVYLCEKHKPHFRMVHTLVCAAFHGPRPEGLEVRHLNDVKDDNRSENLAWGTPKENKGDARVSGRLTTGERSGNTRLTTEDVRRIRQFAAAGEKQQSIADRFGITHSSVSAIVCKKRWAHVA